MKRICCLLLFLAVTAALPGTATASILGTAGSYNGFVFNDFTSYYSDTEGRLAAGGDVNLTGYGVGNRLPAGTSSDVLTAGGNLTALNGQVYHADARVGGSADTTGFTVIGNLYSNAAMSIDFGAEETYLKRLSASLAALPGTGSTVYTSSNAYELTGNTGDLVVFNLDGNALANASSFNVAGIGEDTTVLFNVSGMADNLGGMQMFLNGMADEILSYSDKFLFNFYQAELLDISYFKLAGSVLAPYADVTGQWGSIYGTLIASSYDGTTELEYNPFSGDIPEDPAPPGAPVPEPATFALLGLGLVALGLAARQKRA